jgi:hypothetical protein
MLLVSMAAEARATLLVADFNDITTGDLKGKGGGTGFSSTWNGSSTPAVVSGNLGSARYDLPPTGTAQHVSGNNDTGLRQEFRSTVDSPTGTVWFSFLAKVDKTGDQAGLSINAPTTTPFGDPGDANVYLTGSTLNYQFGTGTAGTLANAVTIGTTALFVGRVTISSTGADPVSLWLNPDLIANPDITAYTPVYSSAGVDWLSSINVVGAIVAQKSGGSGGAGHVDNFRFSDGGGDAAEAYRDVTGVPEPGSLLVLAGAFGALALRRRRAAQPQSEI